MYLCGREGPKAPPPSGRMVWERKRPRPARVQTLMISALQKHTFRTRMVVCRPKDSRRPNSKRDFLIVRVARLLCFDWSAIIGWSHRFHLPVREFSNGLDPGDTENRQTDRRGRISAPAVVIRYSPEVIGRGRCHSADDRDQNGYSFGGGETKVKSGALTPSAQPEPRAPSGWGHVMAGGY